MNSSCTICHYIAEVSNKSFCNASTILVFFIICCGLGSQPVRKMKCSYFHLAKLVKKFTGGKKKNKGEFKLWLVNKLVTFK